MRTAATLAAILIATTVINSAQAPATTSLGVTGTWNVAVKGPAAHGDMAATMLLRQEGKTVAGTFAVHGTEHTLKGEFSAPTLSLESTDTPADKGLTFTATLKDDGSLTGYLSGPMGDMHSTATRAAAPQH